MNTIKLITVRELLGKSFVIPDYQRGYKWTQKQVEDLLDDLDEFISQPTDAKDDFYCLQPLAVFPKIAATNHEELKIEITKAAYPHKDDAIAAVAELYDSKTVWDVIDGQQRLTTVYLLLCYLEQDKYSIKYETRSDSTDFLSVFVGDKMPSGRKEENVDFFHMYEVYERIVQWFNAADKKIADYKKNFIATLLDKTRFIWYEATGDPIQVFTRLNIGKISLTNSELIKALIINNNDDKDNIEITKDWNDIEQHLQNDEFWYFIHSADYNKPTRIDYLFDVLCECDIAEIYQKEKHKTKIGTDQYRTFRHFDIVLKKQNQNPEKSNGAIVWGKLKSLYEVLLEWYNDLRYYHYIGYLMCNGLKLNELYKKWNGYVKKDEFINFLKEEIKKILQGIYKKSLQDCKTRKQQDAELADILNIQYELDGCIAKTEAKPILLLHNIQTVINQNKQSKTKDEFKHTIFYRFPFHLYKTEKWDVEHVDSNTTNNLKDNFSKLIWMLQYYNDYYNNGEYKSLYDAIVSTLNGCQYDENGIKQHMKNIKFNGDGKSKFEYRFEEVAAVITEQKDIDASALSPYLKNQIGNFTLLDQSTNRGYGNSIFPSKRKEIMARDRNMAYQLTYDGNNQFKDEPTRLESGNASTFIPPVTRNIFMKYYTPTATNFATWDENDFDGYKTDIESLLKEFFKK